MNGLTFWSLVACYIGSSIGFYYLGFHNGREKTRAFYRWINGQKVLFSPVDIREQR